MKLIIRTLAAIIALAVGGVSLAMTFSFGLAFAVGPDRYVYAGLFAGMDAAKFLLPTLAAYLAFQGSISHSRIARFLYLFFAVLSASSHVGLTLTVKDREAADANTTLATRQDATAARDLLKEQIEPFKAARSLGKIEADIAKAEREPIFTDDRRSARCTNDTEPESRKLCDALRGYRGEKADRIELDKLTGKLADAQQKLDSLNGTGSLTKANILAATIADKTGADQWTVLIIIAIVMAIGIEFGSSLLMELAMAAGHKPEPVAGNPISASTDPPAAPIIAQNGVDARDDGAEAERVPSLPVLDPKEWVSSRMQPKRGARMPYDAAFAVYAETAAAEGMAPASQNAFSRALTGNGYDRKRPGGVTMIMGATMATTSRAKLALVS